MLRLRTILVDARCLQDDAYRFRGIGQHAASVLREARAAFSSVGGVNLVGILDRDHSALEQEHAHLFDLVGFSPTEADWADWYLALSPMTHSLVPMAHAFLRGSARQAAVIYDFIPLEAPDRYLGSRKARADYLTGLRWLSYFSLLLPISEHTSSSIAKYAPKATGVRQVTGVSVRNTLVTRIKGHAIASDPYMLVIGGGDARKNVEAAIHAHAHSDFLGENSIRLLIVGHYLRQSVSDLRKRHQEAGGDPELLEFVEGVSDAELGRLYRDAIVTICPSRTEGFSIPVVEANANGCPVIVANCPAQTELVPFPEDHFAPDDHARLTMLMELIARDPGARARVMARQKDLWRRFEAKAVGQRFWAPFLAMQTSDADRPPPRSVAIRRGAKPKIAVISPLPPDKSGVADYTAACLKSLSKSAEVHVFTETPAPAASDAYTSVNPLSPLPYLSGRFDAVVSVIGNSHFHKRPLDLLLNYGGAAIAHDARMINFYAVLYGPERATAIASREMGREVDWPEVESWLHNQRRLPTLFLSEVLQAATPTIVHSRVTQDLITSIYKKPTTYLPFSSYRAFPDQFLTPAYRRAARERLGLTPTKPVISCFGAVTPDKAPEECIWALAMLNHWGWNADLWFVGGADAGMRQYLGNVATQAGVAKNVRLFSDLVSEQTYLDFLAATDAALAFRSYGFGGLSGGLLDCIASGVRTVSNAHLAEAMDGPDFVTRVPDGISPVLIAEHVHSLLGVDRYDAPVADAARAYVAKHSFDPYSLGLLGALGLASSDSGLAACAKAA